MANKDMAIQTQLKAVPVTVDGVQATFTGQIAGVLSVPVPAPVQLTGNSPVSIQRKIGYYLSVSSHRSTTDKLGFQMELVPTLVRISQCG